MRYSRAVLPAISPAFSFSRALPGAQRATRPNPGWHPICGVDVARCGSDHGRMELDNHSQASPQSDDPRMQRLLEIKAQMEEIHAKLEYLRLMLRLGQSVR